MGLQPTLLLSTSAPWYPASLISPLFRSSLSRATLFHLQWWENWLCLTISSSKSSLSYTWLLAFETKTTVFSCFSGSVKTVLPGRNRAWFLSARQKEAHEVPHAKPSQYITASPCRAIKIKSWKNVALIYIQLGKKTVKESCKHLQAKTTCPPVGTLSKKSYRRMGSHWT